MKFTAPCGSVGATSGRGVSVEVWVGVADGSIGDGVTVSVDVKVAVGIALAVCEGVTEAESTCTASEAQPFRRKRVILASSTDFFIVRIDDKHPSERLVDDRKVVY